MISGLGLMIVFLAGCSQGNETSSLDVAQDSYENDHDQSVDRSEGWERPDDTAQIAAESDEGIVSETIKPSAEEALVSANPRPLAASDIRAVWSWAGAKGMPGRNDISKRDVDELVAKVDAAHLNVIFLAVYRQGTAFFEPSHTRFPDDNERLTNQSLFEDEEYADALSYLLAIRNQRRLDDNPANDFEVHAWFNVNQGGFQRRGWPPQDRTEPYMLHALFPEFKQKLGAYYLEDNDQFLNHDISVIHQPKFRAYMVDLIAGLVEDYEVDGVHLDHIRMGGLCFNDDALDYPGTEYDFPGCQEDYKAWARENYGQEYTLWDDTDGDDTIHDEALDRVAGWQERAMGLLVNTIHDEVKAVGPEVTISVASVRNDVSQTSMKQLISGQVAWEWLDNDWIDAVFVTAYSTDTQAVVDKIQAFRDVVQNESRRSKVFPGLITYSSENTDDNWSYLIVEQTQAVLAGSQMGSLLEPPAKGVALYLDRRLSDEAVRLLADGPFKEAALPIWSN
jgi:uncharacterized lipoprotein YddW (UPF0748 family)